MDPNTEAIREVSCSDNHENERCEFVLCGDCVFGGQDSVRIRRLWHRLGM